MTEGEQATAMNVLVDEINATRNRHHMAAGLRREIALEQIHELADKLHETTFPLPKSRPEKVPS